MMFGGHGHIGLTKVKTTDHVNYGYPAQSIQDLFDILLSYRTNCIHIKSILVGPSTHPSDNLFSKKTSYDSNFATLRKRPSSRGGEHPRARNMYSNSQQPINAYHFCFAPLNAILTLNVVSDIARRRATSAHSRYRNMNNMAKKKAFRGDIIRQDDRNRMALLVSHLASLRSGQPSNSAQLAAQLRRCSTHT